MSLTVMHSRIQHGVGQGSFHSATVEVKESGRSHRFDYVYDCGALSVGLPTEELKRSIKRMDVDGRKGDGHKGIVDLLVLSHYDKDHTNGAELLIKRYKVKRIVVPYLGPNELALVIASQATNISSDAVTGLHQLANGGQTLFGVQVTMVRSNFDDVTGDEDGMVDSEDDLVDGGQGADEGLPRTIFPLVDSKSMQREMNGNKNVELTVKQIPFWKLRFWNCGVDPDLLKHLKIELEVRGFPWQALSKPAAASDLNKWLSEPDNRSKTIEAYRTAIVKYAPTWKSEAASGKLANFLSLTLYSGPYPMSQEKKWVPEVFASFSNVGGYPQSWCQDKILFLRNRQLRPKDHINLMGWLGTGDAPLGENKIWSDFAKHYKEELLLTGTVQVPHHGAAPVGGPLFYNPELHPTVGMLAVISAGKKNTYGHPRAAVIKQILTTGAKIELVTEDTTLGLHELFIIKV